MLRVLATLLVVFVACSQAALIIAPVPTAAKGSNDVVGVLLQNPTSSALKSQYITFGHPFYKTQLVMPANSTIMTAYFTNTPATTIEIQVDAKAHHDDGSVKQATLTLLQPSIPAGSTISLMLTRTLRATTPLSLSGLPSPTVNVNIKTNDSKNFNYDVKQLVSAAATPNYWLQGELAVQTRISTWVSLAFRMVFDVTLYKDNSWCVDVIYSNDIYRTTGGGVIIYDTTITPAGGAAITYKNLTHHLYRGFHKFVCSAGISEVNVQYDQLNMIQAAAILPLNYTIGIEDFFVNTYTNNMNASTWGVPLGTNGVYQYMPATGDRDDIGALPAAMARWFISQHVVAKKYMMGWGDISHSVPWNFYLNNTDRYVNYIDYPGVTVYADSVGGWTPEQAHNPSLAVLPYVVSGSRYYLDLINAEASWKIMASWSYFRGGYTYTDKGLVCVGVQVRDQAWSFRDIGWAAWLNPTGSWNHVYFDTAVKTNLDYLLYNQTSWWGPWLKEIAGFIYIDDHVIPPWQSDFMTSAFAMLAMQGYQRAADIMLWMRNWQIIGATTKAGWNRNNRCAYHVIAGWNSTTLCTTWACVQNFMNVSKLDMPDLQHIGGNYAQMARQTFILYQLIFPQDTDATAARAWLENGNAESVNDATYRNGDCKTNVGNFPLAVPLNYTFTPGTPSPGSSTLGPVSTTHVAASTTKSSASSTTGMNPGASSSGGAPGTSSTAGAADDNSGATYCTPLVLVVLIVVSAML